MLVVSDIDDVFLPKPTDLLVNLAESRASLEALFGSSFASRVQVDGEIVSKRT
jgi:hypothetical protein